jgi:hypothetical protein
MSSCPSSSLPPCLEKKWRLFRSLAIDFPISNANNLFGELWGGLLQQLLKGTGADHGIPAQQLQTAQQQQQ